MKTFIQGLSGEPTLVEAKVYVKIEPWPNPNFDVSGAIDMREVFRDCHSLQTLDMSSMSNWLKSDGGAIDE